MRFVGKVCRMKSRAALCLASIFLFSALPVLAQTKAIVPDARVHIADFSGTAMSSGEIVGSLDFEGRWTFKVTTDFAAGFQKKEWSAGMSFADSTRLTAMLSEPSLYRESGVYEFPNCLDGEQTRIEIQFKSRRHKSVHVCRVQGRSGAVATFIRAHLREEG